MNRKIPNYAYLLAIFFGIISSVIANFGPIYITIPIIFLLGGVIFGYFWPKKSWRWGLWIAGPLCVILGLSLLFAGGFEVFLKKDLPLLLLSVLTACIGGFISSRYRTKGR